MSTSSIPPRGNSLDDRSVRAYLEALKQDLTVIEVTGTSNQIGVSNGDFSGNNPAQVALADNPILPGTQYVIVPKGTTAGRAGTTAGELRYNTDTSVFEFYDGSNWGTVRSDEALQDFIGAMVNGGTNTDIIAVYDDTYGLIHHSTTSDNTTATSGHIYEPGRTLLRNWDQISFSSSTQETWTFEEAFSDTPYSVTATADGNVTVYVSAISSTSATIDTSASFTGTIYVHAIGPA